MLPLLQKPIDAGRIYLVIFSNTSKLDAHQFRLNEWQDRKYLFTRSENSRGNLIICIRSRTIIFHVLSPILLSIRTCYPVIRQGRNLTPSTTNNAQKCSLLYRMKMLHFTY
jgi:hypothetical protein